MTGDALPVLVSLAIGLATLALGLYNARNARRAAVVAEDDSAFRRLEALYQAQLGATKECEAKAERLEQQVDRLEVKVETLQQIVDRRRWGERG